MSSPPGSFTWQVDRGVGDETCFIMIQIGFDMYLKAVLRVYPRPTAVPSGVSTSSLTCSNCSSGYRSNPGAQTCTECGLGYFQNQSIQSTCFICPTGKYCSSATTVNPVSCPAGTYRSTTGASSVSDCVSCPAGDYCPVATTTPPICAANTFTATTGAAVCDNCPAFSTSPNASTNCTCDYGHYHTVVTIRGSVKLSTSGADTYLSSTYPGNTKFTSMGAGLLSYPQIDNAMHVLLVKGGFYSFSSGTYGGSSFGLKLYYSLSGMDVTVLDWIDIYTELPGSNYIIDSATFTSSVSGSAAYLYSTGVTGQGSGS